MGLDKSLVKRLKITMKGSELLRSTSHEEVQFADPSHSLLLALAFVQFDQFVHSGRILWLLVGLPE